MTLCAALIVALAATCALAPPPAQADGIMVYSYQVEEEYTIEIDELGNAVCKDVLVYDPSFFNKQGYQFEHYPFLLSRRYCEPCDIREIENFNADINTQTATITITFDQPGRAYNQGATWELYGFYSEPKFEVDGAQVFEEESSINSEFTLWQDLEFKTTTFVKLPAAAQNVHYRADRNALVWELPYVPVSTAAFLGRHQGWFIPAGAVLLVLGLAGLSVLALRFRRLGHGIARSETGVAAKAWPQGEDAPEAPSLAAQARPLELEKAGDPTRRPKFCANCGEGLELPDIHFCPYCGHPTPGGPPR